MAKKKRAKKAAGTPRCGCHTATIKSHTRKVCQNSKTKRFCKAR